MVLTVMRQSLLGFPVSDSILEEAMNEIIKAELWVNKMPIDLNGFTEEFIGRMVLAAVSCLKGAENLKTTTLILEGKDLSISANGKDLSLTKFPKTIITNMVLGMVSPLKGVDQVNNLKIEARSN